LTDRDSSSSDVITDSCFCRSMLIWRRSLPTRRLIHTKPGSVSSDTIVSCQSSKIIATRLPATVVTEPTTVVATLVTVWLMPPMSLTIRDCTSPVRVRVKNASDMRCRCW
jgi:hypothetical protein